MKKKKILLVDDDQELLAIMKLDLAFDNSYEITASADPREALERLAAGDFDLVLTDFHMPHMDGGELVFEIKRIKPTIPVFIFSIYHDDTAISEEVRKQVDAIVAKPIDHDQLRKLIQERVN